MRLNSGRKQRIAFTLVEVILALGITSFAILTIIGLLSVALRTNGESVGTVQAANAASRILAVRRASPTNVFPGALLPSLARTWSATPTTGYVSEDGTPVASLSGASFYVSYEAGTNANTGVNMAGVHLWLGWPPAAKQNAPNRYEVYSVVSW